MKEKVDCVVIGAGVVGLAIAKALAESGRDVIVLEKASTIGSETSSRNSGVIHAGIYYPEGSLKARLCRQGRDALYVYCAHRDIAHKRCGKLIVATREEQRAKLSGIEKLARANGVEDLYWLDRDELRRLEPELNATTALASPATGIVDVHALMLAYQADIEASGGSVICNAPVSGGSIAEEGIEIEAGDSELLTLNCKLLVNSAGLAAQSVARSLKGIPAGQIPEVHFAIGHYYSLSGQSPFSHLIYPVPEDGGLGIHLTLDLGIKGGVGQARFGPDVRWIDTPDYAFDDAQRARFIAAISDYYPGLNPARLHPGYTGIRPKLCGAGGGFSDFRIDGAKAHGVRSLINLFGIESPGLTASLAIAETVKNIAEDQL